MSAGTLNTATFTVTKTGGIAVTGQSITPPSLSLSGRVRSQSYSLYSHDHHGSQNLARNPLGANYVWDDTGRTGCSEPT
jgi:hypothetical protein